MRLKKLVSVSVTLYLNDGEQPSSWCSRKKHPVLFIIRYFIQETSKCRQVAQAKLLSIVCIQSKSNHIIFIWKFSPYSIFRKTKSAVHNSYFVIFVILSKIKYAWSNVFFKVRTPEIYLQFYQLLASASHVPRESHGGGHTFPPMRLSLRVRATC